MKILTIIVSYNFMPWMDRCLGSLRRSEVKTDVMVLDNNSADDTVEAIRSRYPEVMLVENKANLGFGRANNLGMNFALEHGYDGVLLLNQDAWVDADVVGRLAKMSREHPEFGILSPVHLTGSGLKVEHGFGDYSGIRSLDEQPEQSLVAVGFIDAAIWYMPVEALRRVGLFAPIFYHYGEDKDLCNRMAYHRLKVGYVPRLYGYHDREFRKSTREGFFRAERVYLLSEFANVNYGFARAFAMGVLASGKKMLRSALHLRLRDALSYVGIGLRLALRSREIAAARRMSKHVDLSNYAS